MTTITMSQRHHHILIIWATTIILLALLSCHHNPSEAVSASASVIKEESSELPLSGSNNNQQVTSRPSPSASARNQARNLYNDNELDGYYHRSEEEQVVPDQQQQAPPLPTQDDQYLIGVGMADITGPAADINLMGYAKPNQDSGGIHLRQFSRAIILVDSLGSRIVYISLDNGMVSQLLRIQVLKNLEKKYKALYNANNVMISASHSHSCPGGFFQFVLYNIPSQGFISQTLEALVSGILRSVDRAHNNMKLGQLSYTEGKLLGASINRSPTAYDNNPASERLQYEYNTDNEMVVVRLADLDNRPLAMMNWFPVHGTSMNNSNHLISGDNKGYASILFEEQYNNGALPGKGEFVAIFGQANEGDVSPNTRGPRCTDTGLPCDTATSTCGNPPRIYRRSRSWTNQKQQHHQQQQVASTLSTLANSDRSQLFQSSRQTGGNYASNYQNQQHIHHPSTSTAMALQQPAVLFGRKRDQEVSLWPMAAGYRPNSNNKNQNYGPTTYSHLYGQQFNPSEPHLPLGSAASTPNSDGGSRKRRSYWPGRFLQKMTTGGDGSSSFVSTMFKSTSRSSEPLEKSTNEKCISSGPGRDMFESTKIIAYKQYNKAKELFEDEKAQIRIRGPVRFIHQHVDMSSQVVERDSTGNVTRQTCLPALGYSFAAGTTDGPGAFDFQQGDTSSSMFWNTMRDFIRRPSEQQIRCHHPKPVLFSTGEMNFPYAWHPLIVPTQILMVGQLAIVGLPGEFTTMAGRRIRNSVSCIFNQQQQQQHHHQKIDTSSLENTCSANQVPPTPEVVTTPSVGSITNKPIGNNLMVAPIDSHPQSKWGRSITKREATTATTGNLASELEGTTGNPFVSSSPAGGAQAQVKVVLSGLSNIYSSYVTTLEEYQAQRYEGASTIYGPHTAQAYLQQFVKLAKLLTINQPVDEPGPEPPNLLSQQIALRPGVIFDSAPYGKHFGQVVEDVNINGQPYKCRSIVRASFIAGHPRNDLRHEGTFMVVERYNNKTKSFDTIASDSSWDTKFIWRRINSFLGESEAILEWDLPYDCQTGIYRMRHFGASKNLMQQIRQYSGQTSVFQVLANEDDKEELDQLVADHLEHTTTTTSINPGNLESLASGGEQVMRAAKRPDNQASANSDQLVQKPSQSIFSPVAILNSILNWRH